MPHDCVCVHVHVIALHRCSPPLDVVTAAASMVTGTTIGGAGGGDTCTLDTCPPLDNTTSTFNATQNATDGKAAVMSGGLSVSWLVCSDLLSQILRLPRVY